MKTTPIITLEGKPILNGELLFDDYKISFRNSPFHFVLMMINFGTLSLFCGLSTFEHNWDELLSKYLFPPIALVISFSFLIATIIQYPKAKKMHLQELKFNEIDVVYLEKSRYWFSFTFETKDGEEQSFKTKINKKSEKLINVLSESGVEICVE